MNNITSIQENKDRRTGIIVSVVLHALLLLLLYFAIVWTAPDPPLPVYGVELNYGTDNQGSGDTQSMATPSEENNDEDAKPGEEAPSTPQEATEEAQETTEEVTTTTQESIVEATKEAVKNPVTDPVKEPTKQPVKEAVKENPVKDPGNGGKDGTKDVKAGNNNGDDANKVGDKGDPRGTLDGRALYGNPGGGNGGGAALNMAGWKWDRVPKPKDESTESGRIVFEIKIDDEGEIISVKTIEKTVSATVEQFYRKEVERLTFTKTDGDLTAQSYTGTITFIIKSK